jgi:predicted nucleotidyltransferase
MEKRQLPEDFKDFIRYLNSNNVEYLLIGGWAVSIYGNPRLTKDIDFLISSKYENIDKLKKALDDFGAPPIDIEKYKKEEDSVIRMGVSPIQIDIIKQAAGIIMEECYKRKEVIYLDDIEINIISIKDLIINKIAAGRDQDITDANILEKFIKLKKKNK